MGFGSHELNSYDGEEASVCHERRPASLQVHTVARFKGQTHLQGHR